MTDSAYRTSAPEPQEVYIDYQTGHLVDIPHLRIFPVLSPLWGITEVDIDNKYYSLSMRSTNAGPLIDDWPLYCVCISAFFNEAPYNGQYPLEITFKKKTYIETLGKKNGASASREVLAGLQRLADAEYSITQKKEAVGPLLNGSTFKLLEAVRLTKQGFQVTFPDWLIQNAHVFEDCQYPFHPEALTLKGTALGLYRLAPKFAGLKHGVYADTVRDRLQYRGDNKRLLQEINTIRLRGGLPGFRIKTGDNWAYKPTVIFEAKSKPADMHEGEV